MAKPFTAEGDPNCKHLSHYECVACHKRVCTRCGEELAAPTYEWKTGGYWCPDCLAKEPSERRRSRVTRAGLLAQLVPQVARVAQQWKGTEDGDALGRLTWLRLIDEHRIRATRHGVSDDEYRRYLVEIAATAIAAIEALDRRHEPPTP